MDVVVTIAEFKKMLTAQGYAESTIDGYRKNLDQFRRYLEGEKISDLRKVTRQTILDYQAEVMAEKTAMETKALKIRPVKRLFEYLTESNQLLINPTERIVETCRRNRKIGVVLTIKEIKKLFEQPNLSFNCQIRNKAIMELFYSTGIRLDELLALTVHDPDFKDKVLYVRKGKRRKQRVVPLGKSAIRSLKEYLEKIRPKHAKRNPKERTLFLDNTGKPLHPECIRQFIREYRIAAGIRKPVSPHTFRRTCATHLLQEGADIRYIQKLLGHKSLKTTQMYTKVIPVDLKKTHDKTHPGIKGKKEDKTDED
ncbi:MAG: tyrosine-type recombinase/integrase [Proteobacteria bacterium]|nr:tyrosine-type recombinase/integrase [Pseudomonadota bacterium]